MNIFIFLLLLASVFLLLRKSKQSSFSARMISTLIILTAMGATVNLDDPPLGIPGLQPVHLWWLLTFLSIFFESHHTVTIKKSPKFFSLPLILVIVMYMLGFVTTLAASSDHSYYVQGWTRSDLVIYHLIVPLEILLTGWMVKIVTVKREDMLIIQKSLMLAAIVSGVLIAYFFLQRGALTGGWTTYTPGRDSLQKGMGLHSNWLAGASVYFFISSIVMKEKHSLILRSLAIFFSLIGIIFTFSRMAWYAVAAIILLLFPKINWKMRIVLIFSLLIVWQQLHTPIKNRLRYAQDRQDANSTLEEKIDTITAGRLDGSWRPALEQMRKNFLFGSGVASRVVEGYGTGNTHSAYLKILLNHGVVGMALLIILFSDFFIKARSSKLSFYYAIIAMLIMGFVGHIFVPNRGNWPFWILYGMSFNEKYEETFEETQEIA